MNATRRLARWATVAGIVGAATIAMPARAALLVEPPKVLSFRLDDPSAPTLPLLVAVQTKEGERPGVSPRYLLGPWSSWQRRPWAVLPWLGAESEEVAPAPFETSFDLQLSPPPLSAVRFEVPADGLSQAEAPPWPSFETTGTSLASNGFDTLFAPPPKAVPNWRCRRRPVTFVRFGAERDSFLLVTCDGALAPEALDRLSLIAREMGTMRPGDVLPDEPDPEAWERGEWIDGVRVVSPRLVWVLQRLADAFPWRTLYVYSGYRPFAEVKPGSHASRHASGRAMDIAIQGVPNEDLFKACRKLHDVGCGYYPNSKFVHVDVRGIGTGHPFWIDVSKPGEPSRFVDAWPGVIESGGLSWDAKGSGK